MKVELVNCMYEHVFSQSLLYYCISESFYKVPGELLKIMIMIIKKKKKELEKYEQISAFQFLGLC